MFDFFEVDKNEKEIYYQEIKKNIPDNENLIYLDIKTINPSKDVLKIISPKILYKYSILPLFIVVPPNKPVLPKHLNKEYWGSIEGKKNLTLYVAMSNPFDNQALNIIKTITGFSIVSVPAKLETINKFLTSDYKEIVTGKPTLKNDKKNINVDLIFKLVKNNIVYIIVFLAILLGFFAIKIYVKI